MVGVNCADKAWRQGLQQVHRHLHQWGRAAQSCGVYQTTSSMRAGNVECQSAVTESYIQHLEPLRVLYGDLQCARSKGMKGYQQTWTGEATNAQEGPCHIAASLGERAAASSRSSS